MAQSELNLEELYRRHRQGLFALALSITRSVPRAEDAIHEAFVRLCRGDLLVSDPVAYVFSAVRNTARSQMRRARHHDDLPIHLFDSTDGPGESAEQQEMIGVVQRCLEQLDDVVRETVVMRVYGELTFEQIAAIRGEPLQTVASRYRRALGKLREMLANRTGHER